MRGTRTRAAEATAGTADETTGVAAEERRLNLLRKISLAGGTVMPDAEPAAEYGYAYTSLGDDSERDLTISPGATISKRVSSSGSASARNATVIT